MTLVTALPLDAIVEAAYLAILGRPPDPNGRATYTRAIENDPTFLHRMLVELIDSPERRGLTLSTRDLVTVLFRAALGRKPDPEGATTYCGWIGAHANSEAAERVADALFYSAEHQERLLPLDIAGRVMVDHTPNGEFRAILKYLVGKPDACRTIVEVGVTLPQTALSVDLLRYFGWRGLIIAPDEHRHHPIEASLAGLNVALVAAEVLDPDPEEATSPTSAYGAMIDPSARIGLTMPRGANGLRSDLPTVLAGAAIPLEFDVLVLAGAPNTSAVLNHLIATSAFRPEIVVIGKPLPPHEPFLDNMELSVEVIAIYAVASSTVGSIIMARKSAAQR